MVKTVEVKNFTAFSSISLDFGPDLNVLVGENATGKTHLLKLLYSILSVLDYRPGSGDDPTPSKAELQRQIAEKLVGVFRPESLGRLNRKPGRDRSEVALKLADQPTLKFSFAANSSKEVTLDTKLTSYECKTPAFLPTQELLTLYPNFVAVYESHFLEFPETWRDLCVLLGQPLPRGHRDQQVDNVLGPLEDAMGGRVELDRNGRFYLQRPQGRVEMQLVAEGLRKFGMLAQLVATGGFLGQSCLFWDEPEANLNPKLVRCLARAVLQLGCGGTQVFLATHSLYLLREIELLLHESEFEKMKPRFFGFHEAAEGVTARQSASINDIGDITSLEEQLHQSQRYLEINK